LQLCEKDKQKELERIAQEAKEELDYLKEKIKHET
jgi:vacuolar-type H+-ATPase subunit E/Vma4